MRAGSEFPPKCTPLCKGLSQLLILSISLSNKNSAEAYDKYIASFVTDFYRGIIRLIEKAVSKIDSTTRGNIANEIHKHMDKCIVETDNFMGRDNELARQESAEDLVHGRLSTLACFVVRCRIQDYIMGGQSSAFITYGKVGSGKTCFIGRLATISGQWLARSSYKEVVRVVRFLGTTPNCSSIESALYSVCQQLCYNLEVPMEDIPEEFVPLKNFFRMLLELFQKRHMFLIILIGRWFYKYAITGH